MPYLKGIRRYQIRYLFWGSLLGYCGGTLNFLLPMGIEFYPVNPYKIIASFISKSEGPGLRLPSELFYKLPEYFGIEVIEKPQPLVSPPFYTTKY